MESINMESINMESIHMETVNWIFIGKYMKFRERLDALEKLYNQCKKYH